MSILRFIFTQIEVAYIFIVFSLGEESVKTVHKVKLDKPKPRGQHFQADVMEAILNNVLENQIIIKADNHNSKSQ